MTSDKLIFLISQPRSGSTLLQSVLAGHPQIGTLEEPWLLLYPLYALRDRGVEAEFDARLARGALLNFLSTVGRSERDYLALLRRHALELYDFGRQTTQREFFLDKTPRYYFIVDEILELFPRAKIIFLLRNPLAVLASILELWKAQGWDIVELFSTNARHDLLTAPRLITDALGRHSTQVEVIRYEQLVETPEREVKRLCASIGIPYSEAMLTYNPDRAMSKKTFGDGTRVHLHQRPVGDYVDAWMRNLDTPQRSYIAEKYLEALGGEVAALMGYDAAAMLERVRSLSRRSRWRPVVPWELLQRRGWSRLERHRVALIRRLSGE